MKEQPPKWLPPGYTIIKWYELSHAYLTRYIATKDGRNFYFDWDGISESYNLMGEIEEE